MATAKPAKTLSQQIVEARARAAKCTSLYIVMIGFNEDGFKAKVNSASTPDTEYTITRDIDGNLSCSCPATIICKHVGLIMSKGVDFHSNAQRPEPTPEWIEQALAAFDAHLGRFDGSSRPDGLPDPLLYASYPADDDPDPEPPATIAILEERMELLRADDMERDYSEMQPVFQPEPSAPAPKRINHVATVVAACGACVTTVEVAAKAYQYLKAHGVRWNDPEDFADQVVCEWYDGRKASEPSAPATVQDDWIGNRKPFLCGACLDLVSRVTAAGVCNYCARQQPEPPAPAALRGKALARQAQKAASRAKTASHRSDRRQNKRDLVRYAGKVDEQALSSEQEDALACWHATYFPPAKQPALCCFCREKLGTLAHTAGLFCSEACFMDYVSAKQELLINPSLADDEQAEWEAFGDWLEAETARLEAEAVRALPALRYTDPFAEADEYSAMYARLYGYC